MAYTGLYNADGAILTTQVSGSVYTGLFSADGNWNIVINDGSVLLGRYHPCGALNAVIVTDPSAPAMAANGSINVYANNSGGYSPVTNLGARSSTPVTPFSITETDNAEDATSQTTYTWTGRNFAVGGADSTRLVVATITSRQAGTTGAINSVTIGGVAATKIDESRNTNTSNLTTTSIWQAAVPTGTTATIAATFNSAMLRAGCIVYSVRGSNGVAPSGAATANFSGASSSNTATGTITVPLGGGSIICGAVTTVTGTPTITPTNYTTDLGPTPWGISFYSSGKDVGNSGSRVYTMTWNGVTPVLTTGVFSAWGP